MGALPPSRDWIQISVTALPGLAAVIALIFTSLSIRATGTQLQITEQGQITDRYNAAITNLGSSSVDIRLGGIYALQRIMQDSPRDQPTIVAVLCAFVRDHANMSTASSAKPLALPHTWSPPHRPPTDIQAALTVVESRNSVQDGSTTVVDLTGADLSGADLTGAHLGGADLSGANRANARLTGADLANARLVGAHLSNALLDHANFSRATLFDADFTDAYLNSAKLSGAEPVNAIFIDADLSYAKLSGADLTNANFSHATLVAADLTNAYLGSANLTAAWLAGADLANADLSRANLSYADFREADLNSAIFFEANLTGTGLTRASGYPTH